MFNFNALIWFGLFWIDGISTFEDYLMQNPLYNYVIDIDDLVW